MLTGLRKAGQSWLGKALVAILFGLIIISFAIWGIGDIFRGAPRNVVAVVGKQEITGEQFRNAYQTEIQRLIRRTRQPISPERARQLGIESQVLSRLVTEATMDQKARELGLGVSDQVVARSITEDPSFKNAAGQFDRFAFESALRDAGLTEQAFVREQRSVLTRLHIAEALSANLPVPAAAREAIHRYGAERRGTAYFVLPAEAAGEIPPPSEEQLGAFYEERKGTFRAPEYRGVNALVLTSDALMKPESVPEDEVRRRYEQVKGTRFGTPDRRTIQQITFPSAAEAEAAAARLKEGTTFEALAQERNVAPADLTLGNLTRAEVLDPAVAEAAFGLAESAVSAPVQGRFGPVLLRVAAIEAGSVRPFEQVADEIRRELATERAREAVNTVHDQIEDLRASARPLAEIAREKGLGLVQLSAVSRTGQDPSGATVQGVPEREAVLAAAFQSDVGADTEAIRLRDGGYVWYEVTKVDPARDRPLAEVRDQVAAQWRADEVSKRLAEKARSALDRIEKGEAVEAVASDFQVPAKTASDLARNGATDDFSADVVGRIFATPVGKAGSAESASGARVVFKVASAGVPPFVSSTQEAARIEEQLRLFASDDLLGQYIARAQQDLNVRINQDAVRRAVGGET